MGERVEWLRSFPCMLWPEFYPKHHLCFPHPTCPVLPRVIPEHIVARGKPWATNKNNKRNSNIMGLHSESYLFIDAEGLIWNGQEIGCIQTMEWKSQWSLHLENLSSEFSHLCHLLSFASTIQLSPQPHYFQATHFKFLCLLRPSSSIPNNFPTYMESYLYEYSIPNTVSCG